MTSVAAWLWGKADMADMLKIAAPLALGVVALAAGAASAQTMTTNSASYNAGYGRIAGQENRAVEFNTRDANGNRVIVDGVMLTGADQSNFSRTSSGSLDAISGVGGLGSSTAIGNNLSVITQGNYNTVIVNSTQTNNGNVSAGTNVSGGVGSNGK